MSSWTIVRDFMTKNKPLDSVGYQVGLVEASDLFTKLLGCLTEKEREEAFEEWKREPKLVEALTRREAFVGLGLMKQPKSEPLQDRLDLDGDKP